MNFVKDYEELHDKNNEHFKKKVRKECLRGYLPAAASCRSKCARLGLNPKALPMENSPVQI